MEKITVSGKGQIVIPSKVRRRHKIKKGTRLCLEERGEEMVIQVLSEEYFNRLAGVLPSKGKLCLTRQGNGRLFFLGVGGGAGNATHAVNDFRKIANIESYAPYRQCQRTDGARQRRRLGYQLLALATGQPFAQRRYADGLFSRRRQS